MHKYSVPFFEVLQCAPRINGTKLNYVDGGADSSPFIRLTYQKTKQYIWAGQLAARVVRRYKILAAFSGLLEEKIRKKYCLHFRVPKFTPESSVCIGYLTFEGHRCGAIGYFKWERDNAIIEAARYRDKKLRQMQNSKTMKQKTGLELEAWILKLELEVLLNERTKEQSRIRRQQSYGSRVNGTNNSSVGADYGACGQQLN